MTSTIFVEVIQQNSLWCVCFVCHVYESLLSLKDSVKHVNVNNTRRLLSRRTTARFPSEQVRTCLEPGGGWAPQVNNFEQVLNGLSAQFI